MGKRLKVTRVVELPDQRVIITGKFDVEEMIAQGLKPDDAISISMDTLIEKFIENNEFIDADGDAAEFLDDDAAAEFLDSEEEDEDDEEDEDGGFEFEI